MDGFFIGDGSVALLDRRTPSYADQLTGSTVEDSRFTIENDVDRFSGEELLVDKNTIRDVWVESKKLMYDKFDFLSTKSKQFSGMPIKVGDLLFADEDIYFTDTLVAQGILDYYAIVTIAKLGTLKEMKIPSFRFVAVHDCPLCCAANGVVFDVSTIMDVLCRGGNFLHEYCDFDVYPVVYRERYNGPIEKLSESFDFYGTIVEDAPIELVEAIKRLLSDIGFDRGKNILFTNIPLYCKKNGIDNDGSTVLIEEQDKLVVHNSYVDSAGPIEYLYEYLNTEDEGDSVPVDVLIDCEKFFIDGVEVAKYKNHFWNLRTGEKVK